MKKWFIFIMLLAALTAAQLFPAIPTAERDALIALYNSTNGDAWTNNSNWRKPGDPTQFNDPGTEHTWYGVTCNTDLTHVTSLDLYGNNLTGPLPTELNALTYLSFLKMDWNQLNGSIPDLTGLTNLE